jgi:pimeloyl-ACP methyl ester carboxylesterase
MEVAADDTRIAAATALTPFTGTTPDMALRRPLHTARLMAAALTDAVGTRLGLPPVMVPVIHEPGRTALVTDEVDRRTLLRLIANASGWRNELRARGLLTLLRYRPGRSASRLTMPLLVCVVRHDTTISSPAAAAAAASAPRGELGRYDGSHFGTFENPTFEAILEDQIAFLRRHVLRPSQ